MKRRERESSSDVIGKRGNRPGRNLLYVIMLPLFLFFVSCSSYDNDINIKYIDYGTARVFEIDQSDPLGANYYINRDDNVLLFIEANLWPQFEMDPYVHTQKRVKILYDIIDKRTDQPQEAYNITLYNIYDILAKTVIKQSVVEEDPQKMEKWLGNDPLMAIQSINFSGNYLNISYVYPRKEGTQSMINLVADDSQSENGILKLTFRRNANGDVPTDLANDFPAYEGEVSFDLTTLLPSDRSELRLQLNWLEYVSSNWEGADAKTQLVDIRYDPEILSEPFGGQL